jgi:hypothetical protein
VAWSARVKDDLLKVALLQDPNQTTTELLLKIFSPGPETIKEVLQESDNGDNGIQHSSLSVSGLDFQGPLFHSQSLLHLPRSQDGTRF